MGPAQGVSRRQCFTRLGFCEDFPAINRTNEKGAGDLYDRRRLDRGIPDQSASAI
jgi:hypothetical protein